MLIPHVLNGRNKTFWFFDYQGGRFVLPEPAGGETVPTAGMVNSGFTNLQDNITYNSGSAADALGRTFPHGTILDPATTRQLPASGLDPVTGLTGTPGSYVRDPFYNCTACGCPSFCRQQYDEFCHSRPGGVAQHHSDSADGPERREAAGRLSGADCLPGSSITSPATFRSRARTPIPGISASTRTSTPTTACLASTTGASLPWLFRPTCPGSRWARPAAATTVFRPTRGRLATPTSSLRRSARTCTSGMVHSDKLQQSVLRQYLRHPRAIRHPGSAAGGQ